MKNSQLFSRTQQQQQHTKKTDLGGNNCNTWGPGTKSGEETSGRSANACAQHPRMGPQQATECHSPRQCGCHHGCHQNDVPTCNHMLAGRWSSDAFLKHIRRQVQEFTSGVSTRMIQRGSFFNVPHAHSTSPIAKTQGPQIAASQSFAPASTVLAEMPASGRLQCPPSPCSPKHDTHYWPICATERRRGRGTSPSKEFHLPPMPAPVRSFVRSHVVRTVR